MQLNSDAAETKARNNGLNTIDKYWGNDKLKLHSSSRPKKLISNQGNNNYILRKLE